MKERHPELVRGLQERAARAFPPQHAEDAGGWRLRYAPGCPWWTQTAQPHAGAGPGELERRVEAVERFYASRQLVPRFQVSPGACPGGLDALLEGRGYRRHGPSSLQVAVAATAPGSLPVVLADRPSAAWLDVWETVHGDGRDPGPEREMLRRVRGPSTYACALAGDTVIAVGRAVADAGWAGVCSMATLPRARGLGGGRQVLAALGGWAASSGIGRLYLQVERDNTAARRLYQRAGFTEICAYHYRSAEQPRERTLLP